MQQLQPQFPSVSWGSVRRLALVFVHGFMQLQPLKKGAAITQSIVSHHVSCFRDFKMADLPPLAIQTKQQVLKHMAIHDLPNTRKESSKTGCVCNNKGKVQWSKLKFPANTGFDGLNLCGESSPHQKWQWSSGPPNELAHLAMCSCVAESFSVSSAQNLEKSWHCGIHVRYGSFIEILIMSRLRPNTYNSITSWCSPAKHSPYWLGQCKDNVSKRLAVRMSELPKNVWTNKSGGKSRNVVCCGTLTWSDFMGIG